MKNEFCHLHVHNQYSQLDGYGTSEQFAKRASEIGQKYLAITNHGVADGFLSFKIACEKYNIKPIFGSELYIVPDILKKEEKRYHIVCLVKNETGLRNLYKMLTIANLEGFYKRPRVDPTVIKSHRDGLIFTSACALSFVNMEGGKELMIELNSTNDFYLEIMPHNVKLQKEINQQKINFSNKYGIKLIATNDCHYPLIIDSKVQEVLLAIQRKAKWNDKDRWRFEVSGLFLRTYDQMARAFHKQGIVQKRTYEQALLTTIEVAEKCQQFVFPEYEVALPCPPQFIGKDEDEVLLNLTMSGLKNIGLDNQEYIDRIHYELDVIRFFKFQKYFLIVWEIMKWCKENDIFTGIGRGSVGNSLVAYALGITSVDPIKYNLPFERFLSKGRIDYPDIDIDIPDNKRDLVKQHIISLYGEYNVAAISTFLTIKSRGALRDVARVFDVSLREVDIAAKSIPNNVSIQEAIDSGIIEIRDFKKRHNEVVDIAVRLDGQIRASGKHPAGLCISSEDLRNTNRCYLCKRNNELTVNLDMNEVERFGLIKFDILGLSALTILDTTRKLVKQNYDIDIDFKNIPLNYKKVYKEISKGNNIGIFQFGAHTTSNLCVEMGIDNFDDLVAANALSRPGTLASGLTRSYINRKRGVEKIAYIHPKAKDITKDTYGIIVFQEQVMLVLNKLAGLDWPTCDKIRKVIGKSKGSDEFNKYKDLFIDGCLKEGTLKRKEAEHVWEQLVSFSQYGFNKAHAVEYSLIAYYGAYLKFKYPKEYMCALLTHEFGNKDQYIAEAKRLGLEIVLPTRGVSDATTWVPSKDSNKIYCPFIEIKGVGEAKAAKLAQLQKSSFSFFDLDSLKKDKFDILLDKIEKINLLSDDEVKLLQKYFEFPIMTNRKYFDEIGLSSLSNEEIVNCSFDSLEKSLISIRKILYKIDDCNDCDLRKECTKPISPSFGRYNIMIVGEAGGKDEDREGVGFVGASGKLLWSELKQYGLYREMFHVTNCVKCSPLKSKTPSREQIKICSKNLVHEIETLQPILILTFGNTGLKFFKNRESGITEFNKKIDWNNVYNCWVYYCVHPASVLHNPKNKELFVEGIAGFADKLRKIGGDFLSKNKLEFTKYDCPFEANFGTDNNLYEECGSCEIWEDCAIFKCNLDW